MSQFVVLNTSLPPERLPLTTKAGVKVAVEVGRVAAPVVVDPVRHERWH
jgi:hypothetical protein